MRIAFVTPEYVTETNYNGGIANYLHRVSLSLLKLGHEPVIVVSAKEDRTFVHNGIEIHRVKIENFWIKYINIFTYNFGKTPLNWAWQSYKLKQSLKRINSIQPLSIIQYASYKATGLFRLNSVPSVVRLSSYMPLWHKAYGHITSAWAHIQAEKLERKALIIANGLFGPSQVIAQAVEKDIQKRVRIIETPFIMDELDLDEQPYLDLLKEKKYLLFFGTVGLLKGVATIADIIYELLEKYNDIYFVFIGQDAGYENDLMIEHVWRKADRNRGRVLYLGKMKHNQLYPILMNAYAVVLPSRIDNFPNTCLEAMAYKRVVIGTKGTSFEQLITDGNNGFLCLPDNPKGLFKTIDRVIKLLPEQRYLIGERAYLRISELIPEKVVKQLLDYYEEIINAFNGK